MSQPLAAEGASRPAASAAIAMDRRVANSGTRSIEGDPEDDGLTNVERNAGVAP